MPSSFVTQSVNGNIETGIVIMTNYYALRFVLGLTLCTLMGCQSLNGGKGLGAKEDETEYGTPAKVVAIWTNSVFNEQGKPPVRGLGGRIYFYDGQHKPIQVDGKLAVFLYDDTDEGDRTRQEATKVVHFSPAELAANFTPTDFGASYSFWVPWDEVGGTRTQLSVIPVFSSNRGQMLVGKEARHLLPGSAPTQLAAEGAGADANITTAGFSEDGSSTSKIAQTSAEGLPTRPKSTTIKLPPSMQRRLRSSRSPARRYKTPRTSPRRGNVPTHLPQVEASSDATPTATPAAGSQLDPRLARAARSAPQATARARNPLARGESLFSQ